MREGRDILQSLISITVTPRDSLKGQYPICARHHTDITTLSGVGTKLVSLVALANSWRKSRYTRK